MQRTPSTRILIIFAIVLVISALAWASLSALHYAANINNGTLDLTVVPNDSTVVVDNKTTTKPGAISLAPGKHTVAISHTGFGSQTITITTTPKQTLSQSVLLPITSAAAKNYLQTNPKQVAQREGIAGAEASKQGQIITQNSPLITLLPYHGANFDIDYGIPQKDPNSPTAAIYITAATPAAQTNALNWIRAQGYDPTAYEIIYQTSPDGQ